VDNKGAMQMLFQEKKVFFEMSGNGPPIKIETSAR
jgi:hypothetical protein